MTKMSVLSILAPIAYLLGLFSNVAVTSAAMNAYMYANDGGELRTKIAARSVPDDHC